MSVRMGAIPCACTSGVDHLAHEVPTADVLEALRDELANLEFQVLIGPRS
jgi:hypothetical protein